MKKLDSIKMDMFQKCEIDSSSVCGGVGDVTLSYEQYDTHQTDGDEYCTTQDVRLNDVCYHH